MEILGEDGFRVNSYRKVARIIHDLEDDIEALWTGGQLTTIPGIGKSTQAKIEEFLESGQIAAHLELLDQVPEGLPELLSIPGMGPKSVATVWKELDVKNVEELGKAIANGSLQALKGFGAKKAEAIARGIKFREESGGKNLLAEGIAVSDWIIKMLKPGKRQIQVAGSIRRGKETIGDIDILAEGKPNDKLIKTFTELPGVQAILAGGETKASILFFDPALCRQTIQIDLRVVESHQYGAALNYFTGSKEHNVRLRELARKSDLKLNEYGLFDSNDNAIAGENEPEIYQALGLPYIEPTLREDRGEIEAGLQGNLPPIVRLEDIKGDLHMHSPASDGRSSLKNMVNAAMKRGYQYIAITDHSRSSAIANGLDIDRLLKNIEAVHEANGWHDNFTVLASSEVDILANGSLDYPDDILSQLDFVMASVHSGLGKDEKKNTLRIMKAMENPYVNCIGHLTGRMLTLREGMTVDIKAILKQARDTQTALEVSSQPLRLDLCDRHIRMAVDMGVKLIINTDAHDTEGLDLIHFGIATAQRGWAAANDILNTRSIKDFLEWCSKKRQ